MFVKRKAKVQPGGAGVRGCLGVRQRAPALAAAGAWGPAGHVQGCLEGKIKKNITCEKAQGTVSVPRHLPVPDVVPLCPRSPRAGQPGSAHRRQTRHSIPVPSEGARLPGVVTRRWIEESI